MNYDALKKLAVAAVKKAPITYSADEKYSAEDVDSLLRKELNNFVPDYYSFQRNKVALFELISQAIDEVLPRRVEQQYMQFADVRTVPQGQKVIFRQRITEAARKRAKTFVTRVGLAGRYETFMLDGTELEVQTDAIGAACRLGLEEFLDGRLTFADLTDVIMEGMDEYIYRTIAEALAQAMDQLPAANKATSNGFDEKLMDRLLAISDSYYGGNSAIYCTKEFAMQMIPPESRMSSGMKDELWTGAGYFDHYKNHPVIVLAQSMVDATNTEKVIDPSNAYIIPVGAEKPVKLAFEGQTLVRTVDETTNDDWSTDLQTYRKFGMAILMNPAICWFKDTSLSKEVVGD